MKHLLSRSVVILTISMIAALLLVTPSAAQQLPTVWVGGPNPAPCYRSVKVKGKWADHKIACYDVRPPTISLSEDGNGFLSDLHWTVWTAARAVATGFRYVRCYPVGPRDPRCVGQPPSGGYEVPVKVFLTKPVATSHGPLFTVLTEAGFKGQWCVTPSGVGCNTPAATTTTRPPLTVGGQWEFVGFSASGEAVDIVHLALVDFPPGHLTGSWTETAAPGWQPGIELNGTECLGCNGVAGAYSDNFGIVGTVEGRTFTIEVTGTENMNNTFSGALGNSTPYGATRYGCAPSMPSEGLFLVAGSSAYLFFRPTGFPGVAVGRQSGCMP